MDKTSDITPTATLTSNLERYAELLIRSGCNLQPGQELLLQVTSDNVEFARIITKTAYEHGVRHVTVRIGDEQIARLHYENCALEVFEHFPDWQALLNNGMAQTGACTLNIISEDPTALSGVDQDKLVAQARAAHIACKPFYDHIDMGKMVWCIAGAAAPNWAKHVYPTLPLDVATEKLWGNILQTVRIDTSDPTADPNIAWEAHRQSFNARKRWLSERHFDALHYANSLGTDLTVGLNAHGIWQGGGDVTQDGTEFFPNMPTEEIFTSPNYLRADGIVYASMPLVHHGSLIRDFSMTFKDGQVVNCEAKSGREVLEAIFDVDEGARYLGECALVPWSSPIRESGILFYNTLYDENASCHLAVGKGFPDCCEGGQSAADEEELKRLGINISATHVDFMIGTKDLLIEGIATDGSRTAIFMDGEWAF